MRHLFTFTAFWFLTILVNTVCAQEAESIVNRAIANKTQNDPRTALKNFQFDVYEKTVITDSLGDGTHNYLAEKASTVSFDERDGISEAVLGFQLAGFEEPQYQVLAVNLQSRSFYDEDFVIFNTRHAGILSRRGLKHYNYLLQEETPTTYVISFSPKNPKGVPGLVGTMTLDKNNYAISKVAIGFDDGMKVVLNQSYTYLEKQQIYFPDQRELYIDKGESDRRLSFFGGRISIGALRSADLEELVAKKYLVSITDFSNLVVTGKNEQSRDVFAPYAIYISPEAVNQTEEFWQTYRIAALTEKDKRSFSEIQKVVNAENIERRLGTINNFSVGYYSVNFFDFDLTYPVKFNNFEGLRLGVGGVTNAGFSERFRLEGYLAYGFKDQEFKYGIGAGYLTDPGRNAWVSLTYNSDLEEVGNYSYLTDRRVYSLFEPRLVNINLFYKHRTTRINYEYRIAPELLSELQLAHRRIDQTTPYRYSNDGAIVRNYDISEITFGLRWSPRSKFMNAETEVSEIYEGFPKVTAQVSQSLDGLGGEFNFTKVGLKSYYKLTRLNKTQTELLLEGNIGFGDIPLTHLYHAYPNAPTKETILQRFSVAGVNSFETMFFGEFFSDKLFTAQVKHRLAPFNLGRKWKPEMVFITRYAVGSVDNRERHLDIEFDSLEKGYTEAGFEINKILFGFGTSLTYRFGGYHLPKFEDNIAFKFTFNLQL